MLRGKPSLTTLALGAFAIACSALAARTGHAADEPHALDEIVVTGVRHSEERAVELKRDADSIQDSIAAEDIGKLPDKTIADSLQRITGVQIDREGGEGTSVNIRGLPQVGTLLNGEAFLTTSSIVGVQPDFGDIPSQLFSGADVSKSPTASLLNAGITGTINLKTQRPFDLPRGWTLSGAAEAARGRSTDQRQPTLDGLVGFHGDSWGIVASAAYSDITLQNSVDGIDQYGGELMGETTDSSTLAEGFLNAYLGAPLPAGMHLLNPSQCTQSGGTYTPTTPNGCDVDVNGDGKANGAFYFTPDFSALDRRLERKRLGFSTSLQAQLGSGLSLMGDFFYTNQKRYDRTTGYQLNTATWNGATFLPVASRNTGVPVTTGYNQGGTVPNDFYTTQVYQDYLGDIETFSDDHVTVSTSRNTNLELHYDQGGSFTADLRAIYATAQELHMESYLQYAVSDGALWPNEPIDAAPVGTYVYPGGNRVFNPYGFAANTIAATVDMRGDHLGITLPSDLQATLRNPNAYALKTVASENDWDRDATMKVLRADGHYKFADSNVTLDFGLRLSERAAQNTNFALIAPVYGGNGAYNNLVDPVTGQELDSTVANSNGCYVHYKAADVLLDGGGVPGACKAGDPVTGFYRANPLSSLNPSQLPAIVADNTRLYNHLANVQGVSVYALDPKIMDDVLAFQNALYPGEIRDIDPGGTWHVQVRQSTGYVQGNFKGEFGVPFSANVGVKLVRTSLGIDQHKVGTAGAYYVAPQDLGITHSDRTFSDVLPVANIAFNLKDDLKLRLAYSKNMQLLNLDQWGGGLTLDYAIVAGTSPPVSAVRGGQQNGNPDLKPWRSANYDVSLEYYINNSSLVSIAAFRVDVASFIANGSTLRCDLPDQDGTVRNRCVAINGPIQGAGKSLGGIELGLKQALTFLPGMLRNLGVDANFTFSPSNTGTDVAGHAIPFQDNSKEQGNVILWYQSKRFQARVAGNYRSKRAVSQDYAGISGFEEYQTPTFYLDASLSYDVTPGWQVYAQGANLTGEKEHYYLVWPDQKLNTTQFESRYSVGLRGRF